LDINVDRGLKMMIGYVCQTFGHKIMNTYSIENTEDCYEVNDAKYCIRCGEINPKIRKSIKPLTS
jgi:hypothetical protein